MIPLPASANNELDLADWLELCAITSADRNSSIGDLERNLARAPQFDGDREALENKLADVSKELGFRSVAAEGGYPFAVDGGVLKMTGNPEMSTYIFCLFLSYLPWKRPAGVFPARIFEAISTEAARLFLTGPNSPAKGLRFGAPRKKADLPTSFRLAVDSLCKTHIREGGGWPPTRTAAAGQDAGLDVVAWREWTDELPGKLCLFGACATGRDWEEKVHDIMPDEFCGAYMDTFPATPILRGFFVPFRIGRKAWTDLTRSAGIVFDRCRIAYLVNDVPQSAIHHGDSREWVKSRIDFIAA